MEDVKVSFVIGLSVKDVAVEPNTTIAEAASRAGVASGAKASTVIIDGQNVVDPTATVRPGAQYNVTQRQGNG